VEEDDSDAKSIAEATIYEEKFEADDVVEEDLDLESIAGSILRRQS
jgi:hypothetical protein